MFSRPDAVLWRGGRLGEMVREPVGERDDHEGRIGGPAGREDRASGDEEVLRSVDLAVAVDRARRGIVGHARRAEMVVAPGRILGLVRAGRRRGPGVLVL